MQKTRHALSIIYLSLLLLSFAMVVGIQLCVDHTLADAISSSNYFALYFASLVFAPLAAFAYSRDFRISTSDLIICGLAIVLVVHSRDGLRTKEVVMSLSYISLYFSLRIANSRFKHFTQYAVIILLLLGIHQSSLVLLQVFGDKASNNSNFLVSGSFFNPGPCGIFLGAILVLALRMLKNCKPLGEKFNFNSFTYYLSVLAAAVCFMAIVPTLSRAGWLGAAVGAGVLYHKDALGWVRKFCIAKNLKYKIIITLSLLVIILGVASIYLLKKDSANGRIFMWHNTISASLENPVFGVGLGNFSEYYADAQSSYFHKANVLENPNPNTKIAGSPQYPFNEFLALLLSLGFVGLVLVLFTLYQRVSLRRNPMSVVAISILVSAVFSYPFYVPLIGITLMFALSCGESKRAIKMHGALKICVLIIPSIMLVFILSHVNQHRGVLREWNKTSMFYKMKNYEYVAEDSPLLLPMLSGNSVFMFEYGHSLNKIEQYGLSNQILLQGATLSTDPMYWNIIGNNYLAMKNYQQAQDAYHRAYYLCPNRIYPLYLLTKLYHAKGDSSMTEKYGKIVLEKKPKIASPAVDDMKKEVEILLKKKKIRRLI